MVAHANKLRIREEDCYKFKASLDYTLRPYSKKKRGKIGMREGGKDGERGRRGRSFISRAWIVALQLLDGVGDHCRQCGLPVIMQMCKASNVLQGSSGQR